MQPLKTVMINAKGGWVEGDKDPVPGRKLRRCWAQPPPPPPPRRSGGGEAVGLVHETPVANTEAACADV